MANFKKLLIEPLRKANPVTVLVLGMIFKTGNAKNALMNYIPFFCTVAGIMVAALVSCPL